jgi:mycothiol synthase
MASAECLISTTTVAHLENLYKLASHALKLDTISQELLQEKLFFTPRPEIDENQTLQASVNGRLAGMMQYVIRPCQQCAWLGLFAVEESFRRQGVATALFARVHSACRAKGIQTIDAKGIPTNYLVPGIDPRYTAAICLLESLGFTFLSEKLNLRAELDASFDTSADEQRLASQGVFIRRATEQDLPAIAGFFQRTFGDDWRVETTLAMTREPPAVHLALKGSDIVGFAAHSGMNREWGNFGPMGIVDEMRGLGIGRILLYRCMKDLKDAGHTSAVIPWVGPYRFYCRHLTCAIDRVFWQYRLERRG